MEIEKGTFKTEHGLMTFDVKFDRWCNLVGIIDSFKARSYPVDFLKLEKVTEDK